MTDPTNYWLVAAAALFAWVWLIRKVWRMAR